MTAGISQTKPWEGRMNRAKEPWTYYVLADFSYSQFHFSKTFLKVLFNRLVVSDSLWPHGLQNSRFPCPSLSPRVCSNSCPLNRWCHPTVSSSATPFCPQSFPASVSFLVSLLFASGDQNVGSFIISISPSNEYSGLISIRLDWFDLLAVQGTLKSDKNLGEGLSRLGSSSAAVAPDKAGSRTSGSISRSLLLALSWQLFFLLCRLHVRVVSLLSSV